MLIVWRDEDGDSHDGGSADHHKRYAEIHFIQGEKKKKRVKKKEEPKQELKEQRFESPVLDRNDWIDREVAAMRSQLADLAGELARLEQLKQFQVLGDLQDRFLAALQAEYSKTLDDDFFFLLLLSEED